MVRDALSSERPKGWSTIESLLNIKALLKSFNWTLEWSSRTTNKLVDPLAKLTFIHCCNFSFSSDNLERILNHLSEIYVSEIDRGQSTL